MASNKNFTAMKTNVGNEVGDTSSSFATRVGVYINNRYRDVIATLINADVYEQFRTVTLTTTASTRNYTMPFDFNGEIVYAQDTTNNRELEVMYEREWLQRFSTGLNVSSNPINIIPLADSTVRVQPSSASTLKILSSSSTDNTYNVFVRGISGSAEFYETISASGVSSGVSANTYDYVLQIHKAASTNGAVTITYVGDSAVASVISPQSNDTRYRRVGFYYVPSGTFTIDVRYRRELQPLVNDSDAPLIDVADIIELGAKSDAWRTKRFPDFANEFEQKYQYELDKYVYRYQSNKVNMMGVTPADRDATY